jgi:hypothetical protein
VRAELDAAKALCDSLAGLAGMDHQGLEKVTLRLEELEAVVGAAKDTLHATGLKVDANADEATAALEIAREQLACLGLGESLPPVCGGHKKKRDRTAL